MVRGFIVRQGVIFTAGCLFLLFSAVRIKTGRDPRDLRTFVSDVSKQSCQQLLGGTMMMFLGLELAKRGASPLAWYGAEYPFEVILTTAGTGFFKFWSEQGAKWGLRTRGWKWAEPYTVFGQYGPNPGDWTWSWYWAQLAQAIFLIAVPSRVIAIALIYYSVELPAAINPMRALAYLWFDSGFPCATQQLAILYLVPLLGDVLQFIAIDRLQAAKAPRGSMGIAWGSDAAAAGGGGWRGGGEALLGDALPGSSTNPSPVGGARVPGTVFPADTTSSSATPPASPPPHGAELIDRDRSQAAAPSAAPMAANPSAMV